MDFSLFIDKKVFVLALAVVALIWFAGRIPIGEAKNGRLRRLKDSKTWRRILPLLPLALGVGGAFLPGVLGLEPGRAWGEMIVVGIWAGFIGAHGRKIVKRALVDRLGDLKSDQ